MGFNVLRLVVLSVGGNVMRKGGGGAEDVYQLV